MTTTILPDLTSGIQNNGDRIEQGFSLLLACNYILILGMIGKGMFISRHGWGTGQISPTVIAGLFLLLILLHVLVIIPAVRTPRLTRLCGAALTAVAVFLGGILLFSAQTANLLKVVHPAPVIVILLLVLSLLYGVLLVIRSERPVLSDRISASGIGFPASLASRYEEVQFITAGGVGTIWYARYQGGEEVAVKIPSRSDEQTGSSFLQEIQLWRELEHENIVRIRAANILPVPYIEMDYYPLSLRGIHVPTPLADAIRITSGIVAGLSYAHGRGIAHCDIKPGNILLSDAGTVKITDWGISHQEKSRWPVSGFSLQYAAPEQRGSAHECGPAVDVYQTGRIMAWLLTGSLETPSGAEQVFSGEEGGSILRIIRKCMEDNSLDRYADCQGMRKDLDALVQMLNHSDDYSSSDPAA